MDIQKTLLQAIDQKRHLLDEDMGKSILSQYGMKVPPGKRVTRLNEIQAAAKEL